MTDSNDRKRRDIGDEIVHDLGIAPALDVDDDQRFEKLREFHAEDSEREAAERRRHEAEEN